MERAIVYEVLGDTSGLDHYLQAFQGRFFIEPIYQAIQMGTLSESVDFKVVAIRFFVGAQRNSRTMVIGYFKTNGVQASLDHYLKSIPGLGSVDETSPFKVFAAPWSLETELPAASKFLRNTNTLSENDFKKYSNLHISADAHGVAIVGNGFGAVRFERACQSVALSCAYRSVLNGLICDLSTVGRSQGSQAEDKLKEWAYFMSAYYFVLPIRQNTIELCEIYSAVNNRQKLDVLAKEATEQLQLLAKLVRLNRTEAQGQQDKKFQAILTTLGLVIAVIGALQIVQITPKTLKDFYQAWTGWCSTS